MGILVIGTAFVDIKGFPDGAYIPTGRNVGQVKYIHGGVARNVVEDIANLELRPTYLGIVDDTPMGADVLNKLKDHKVNTDYVLTQPDGMGLYGFPHTPIGQAAFFSYVIPKLRKLDFLAGAIVYCWSDNSDCYVCGQEDCPVETKWGLVDGDGNPKPAYYAVKYAFSDCVIGEVIKEFVPAK